MHLRKIVMWNSSDPLLCPILFNTKPFTTEIQFEPRHKHISHEIIS